MRTLEATAARSAGCQTAANYASANYIALLPTAAAAAIYTAANCCCHLYCCRLYCPPAASTSLYFLSCSLHFRKGSAQLHDACQHLPTLQPCLFQCRCRSSTARAAGRSTWALARPSPAPPSARPPPPLPPGTAPASAPAPSTTRRRRPCPQRRPTTQSRCRLGGCCERVRSPRAAHCSSRPSLLSCRTGAAA